MVGVPRSKGCVACRKQKKKCTVLSKPPCTRCTRLKISCTGYNELRFKFQDETLIFGTKNKASTCPLPSKKSAVPDMLEHEVEFDNFVAMDLSTSAGIPSRSKKTRHKGIDDEGSPQLTSCPTNMTSSLIDSYLWSIDSRHTDTGNSLSWNFGAFLEDLPRYLGSNKTLDIAADALVASYHNYRMTDGKRVSTNSICLEKYARTVTSIRKSLSDVETACDPATLCAIQIVMTIEALLGISDLSPMQHAGGAAVILKARGKRPPKDKFEELILKTLRGPVTIQAFFLNEDFYTESEWHNLISGFTGVLDEDKGFFPSLTRTARLFQRTRRFLETGPITPNEEDELIAAADTLHDTIAKRIDSWSWRLSEARDAWFLNINSKKHRFEHGSCTREYGLLSVDSKLIMGQSMCTQIEVNCILSALRGEFTDVLKSENSLLCRAMYTLCESDALCHRPLGTCWVMIAMSTAYIGATDLDDKKRVLGIIRKYTHDIPRESAELVVSQMDGMARHLTCADLVPGLFPVGPAPKGKYVYYDAPGLESL